MNLEINSNHKKVNLSKIALRNKIFSSVMATSLSLVLFSGCARTNNDNKANIISDENVQMTDENYFNFDYEKINNKINEINNNGIINVPNSLKKYIVTDSDHPETEIITKEYLESLTSINLSCFDLYDPNYLLWLNYCVNLESLNILVFNDDILKGVLNLPNLKNLSISNFGDSSITLDRTSSGLLTSDTLEYLKLTNLNVEKGLLEHLSQLKTLDISDNDDFVLLNYDIDFSKLNNLENLIISNPYSLIARMSTEEYETLLDSGVNIVDSFGKDQRPTVRKIVNKIDRILDKIDLSKAKTEEDKFKIVLSFVLDNFEYNNDIDNKIKNHEAKMDDINPFYDNGYLNAALNNDTQICGNYAALVTALCDRLNIGTFVTVSNTHAWNLVYLDGNYYYIDATIIDNESNNQRDYYNNEWFLKDPNSEIDRMHTPINLPDIISIERIDEQEFINETEDMTNKEYKVIINEKEYIVGAAALVGMLTALGVVSANKKKNMNVVKNEKTKTR